MTLLPSAFSKLTRIYAYIDTKNQWLVLGTTNAKKTEQFIANFKKSVSEDISTFELRKISLILTDWVKHKNYPTAIAVEKACVLQDPKQQSRIIRCQQQDVFANGIQTLIKEGCEVIQLALQWQDQMHFVFSNKFQLQSIKYGDEIIEEGKEMEPETKLQQFTADFFIMTQSLSLLINELLNIFADTNASQIQTVSKAQSSDQLITV
jgi:recombination associated protein RdgC